MAQVFIVLVYKCQGYNYVQVIRDFAILGIIIIADPPWGGDPTVLFVFLLPIKLLILIFLFVIVYLLYTLFLTTTTTTTTTKTKPISTPILHPITVQGVVCVYPRWYVLNPDAKNDWEKCLRKGREGMGDVPLQV